MSSITWPLPDSSPKMMVPHGVRLTGSHEVVPLTMVCTAPDAMSMRCRPGAPVPCSLQPMMAVGESLLGQSAIMSVLGAVCVVTTWAVRPWDNDSNFVGSALASAALIEACDDASIVDATPNSCWDWSLSLD